MKYAKNIIAAFYLLFLSSCGDGVAHFYKQNSTKLEQLAKIIEQDKILTGVCCIKDTCMSVKAVELMYALHLECLRKDTADGTVNFILDNKSKKLQSAEIVYLYQNAFGQPKEYPNAGIYIKKINRNWFIRKYFFD